MLGWVAEPSSSQVMLVMQYAARGSLESLIERKETARWVPVEMLEVAESIARGIAFLHSQKPPIVHRDIKPSNILFTEDATPMLADFGASRAADGSTLTNFAVGTLLFSAPEQLKFSQYNQAVDLWSFGCVLSCIARDSLSPYEVAYSESQDSLHLSLHLVSLGEMCPSAPLSHCLHSFVEECCAVEAELRPEAAALVEQIAARGAEEMRLEQGPERVRGR